MPKSNWRGHISFGLVSIPVTLFNAENPASRISFHQINKKTGDKIKYKRVDAETNKEVPWEYIGKGYEYDKDTIIPIEDEELKRVAGGNARTIVIEEFIEKSNLQFIDIEKTYYLLPEKGGDKGYVILREALHRTNKVGIAKVIISTKEYLAAVSTFKNALVLYLLHYQEEIRALSEFDFPSEDLQKSKVSSREIAIAKKLIDSMSTKWYPEKYKDEYKTAIEHWLTQKLQHLPKTRMVARSKVKRPSAQVMNFIELLKQSLRTNASKHKTPERKAKIPPRPSRRGGHRKVIH